MKVSILVLLIWTTVFASVYCKNYLFGVKTNDVKLEYRTKVKYEALPLQKRIKYFSYNSTHPIKVVEGAPDISAQLHAPCSREDDGEMFSFHNLTTAINCFDYQNSEASINITEGGIEFHHVTLRMKSQRSYRLEYSIDIYV